MTAKEYCIAFCEGYFCAQLGENLTNGKVTEHNTGFSKGNGSNLYGATGCLF